MLSWFRVTQENTEHNTSLCLEHANEPGSTNLLVLSLNGRLSLSVCERSGDEVASDPSITPPVESANAIPTVEVSNDGSPATALLTSTGLLTDLDTRGGILPTDPTTFLVPGEGVPVGRADVGVGVGVGVVGAPTGLRTKVDKVGMGGLDLGALWLAIAGSGVTTVKFAVEVLGVINVGLLGGAISSGLEDCVSSKFCKRIA